MVFSGAHYLRRIEASDAQWLRHSAHSVRRTHNGRSSTQDHHTAGPEADFLDELARVVRADRQLNHMPRRAAASSIAVKIASNRSFNPARHSAL